MVTTESLYREYKTNSQYSMAFHMTSSQFLAVREKRLHAAAYIKQRGRTSAESKRVDGLYCATAGR